MGWSKHEHIALTAKKTLFCVLLLALIAACQEDEPTPTVTNMLEVTASASSLAQGAVLKSPFVLMATQSPLPTPTATPLPASQIVYADQLPPVSHDLLYLSKGFLRVWDRQTGQVETLVGPEAVGRVAEQQPVNFLYGPGPPTGTVLEYMAGGGGQIAVVTFQRGAADVHPSTNVFLYDRQTRQRLPVPADSGEVLAPTFSPDGNWIAWVVRENQVYAQRPPGLASPAPQAPEGQNFPYGSVYIAPAKSPSAGRKMGTCGLYCG
jgi:hypothetical protein